LETCCPVRSLTCSEKFISTSSSINSEPQSKSQG
jgi:hypothetical protein